MATTLTQLQQLTLNLLNEAANSDAAELASGTNISSPTQTTAQTLTTLINDAAATLAKTCVALPDKGTYTIPIGTYATPMTNFTMTNGGTLWCPQQVSWNGVSIPEMGLGYVMMRYPSYLTDTSGTPVAWYRDGQYQIGLVPRPSAADVVTAWGYTTPAPLVSGGDTIQGFTDDEIIYITYWVAYQVAQKNIENPALQLKIQPWKVEFQAARQRLWVRLLQLSGPVAKAYFSAPASIDEVNDSGT